MAYLTKQLGGVAVAKAFKGSCICCLYSQLLLIGMYLQKKMKPLKRNVTFMDL